MIRPKRHKSGFWDRYTKAALATEKIDFKCGFVNGRCIRARDKKASHLVKCGCCCSNCADHLGYLDIIGWHEGVRIKYLREYERLFDSKNGFFVKGRGCSLPRHMRSSTCLTFSCDPGVYEIMRRLFAFVRKLE
jgi:hypothetical protein